LNASSSRILELAHGPLERGRVGGCRAAYVDPRRWLRIRAVLIDPDRGDHRGVGAAIREALARLRISIALRHVEQRIGHLEQSPHIVLQGLESGTADGGQQISRPQLFLDRRPDRRRESAKLAAHDYEITQHGRYLDARSAYDAIRSSRSSL
jgi:hypothetical protein